MNRLQDATSPYLLLHKDNPVSWYPWGEEAFAEAKEKNKPILLSVGYTSCHWCHVMNHESFADAETAKMMNDLFVCIKVDREERPDVDQIYQAAASTLGNAGGWPLTMFLTPEGLPYFAATFLPLEARGGAPAFKTVLGEVETLYRDKNDAVQNNANAVKNSLTQLWNRNTSGTVDNLLLETASVRIGQKYDIFFGGLTGTPKFPNPPFLEVLWRAHLRTGSSQYLQLAGTTLDQITLGGLQDHVGGGFFRYCTDERWVRPHFEKMLPDNAMMIDIMTLVWQFNRNTLCQNGVRFAAEWLLRDMKVGDAFAASLDADSEGEEGKYYMWTEAEVDAALTGTFVQRFKSAYNVRREGEFIGNRNILHRLGAAAPYPLPQADETLLEKQRSLLLAARQKRVAPMRDDKVLADWNGFAIAALANAGMVFKNGAWVSAAIAAFDFVVKAMGEGDRLYHSWRDGKRGAVGNVDDYASMARAALVLFEATGENRYVDLVKRWVHTLNEHFWDGTNGGYFFKADDADQLFVRSRMMFDQPTPAANSLMMTVLTRLNACSGEQAYFDRAQAIAVAFAAEAQRAWISMPSYFNNVEFMSLATHIVVIGPNDNAKTHELASAVWGRSFPNRFLQIVASSDELPEGHPAKGKPMINGAPTVYICQRGTCSPAVTNPVQLSQILTLPQQRQVQQQAAQ